MRVSNSFVTHKRRKRYLKLAEGYYGSKHTLFKTAKEQVMRSWQYAYRDRRRKKRDFKKLWIQQINAAARLNNISYSQLMYRFRIHGYQLNRKMLALLAEKQPAAFAKLLTTVQNLPAPATLPAKPPTAKKYFKMVKVRRSQRHSKVKKNTRQYFKVVNELPVKS